jgi:undecaprenyl-diphosphatase
MMNISTAPAMDLLQAILIAIIQGMTELFPVSSLGHAVILPALFGWHIDQKAPSFLPFLVVLHLGTALALLIYFWRDWLSFVLAVFGKGKNVKKERQVFALVCTATLPAVIIGFVLEHVLRGFFGAPVLAAVFLIVNGCILFFGERIKHSGSKSIDQVGWKTALIIGACQALALSAGRPQAQRCRAFFIPAGDAHHRRCRRSRSTEAHARESRRP